MFQRESSILLQTSKKHVEKEKCQDFVLFGLQPQPLALFRNENKQTTLTLYTYIAALGVTLLADLCLYMPAYIDHSLFGYNF